MRSAIVAGTLLIFALAGCGGGSGDTAASGSTSSRESAGPPSAAAATQAEAVCTAMVAQSRRMGAEFRRSASELTSSPLAMTTDYLIKPAIPVVETRSRQLRALKSEADSVKFDSYVNLFDPILALLHKRAAAGDAGDSNRAHEIELQLIELTALQGRLARDAGLDACDVDFINTFIGSPGGAG